MSARGKWAVQHSSKQHDWATPDALFEWLNEEFHFDIDAAAHAENAKCERFIGLGGQKIDSWEDALGTTPWREAYYRLRLPRCRTHNEELRTVWLNPPYGRGIGKWVKKAAEQTQFNTTVVMLVFACTDTQWWAEAWKTVDEVRFITGRVHFKEPKGGKSAAAPKGSALLIFRGCRQPEVSLTPRVSLVTVPRGKK